jgi:hypothetical protein
MANAVTETVADEWAPFLEERKRWESVPLADRWYMISTWDGEVDDWTPQRGLPSRAFPYRRLRAVVRAAHALGYERGSNYARLERVA